MISDPKHIPKCPAKSLHFDFILIKAIGPTLADFFLKCILVKHVTNMLTNVMFHTLFFFCINLVQFKKCRYWNTILIFQIDNKYSCVYLILVLCLVLVSFSLASCNEIALIQNAYF